MPRTSRPATGAECRHVRDHTRLDAFSVAAATAIILITSSPLWAIPSPDVVIGLFASAAQVLGLLTVALGSGAWARRRRGRQSGSSASLRWPLRIVVVLLLASLGANALQYSRGVDERAERLRRNLVRSSKENGVQVGDTSLKTLSFSGQQEHARGLTTERVGTLVSEQAANPDRKIVAIVDVREPEEVEMGRIDGARQVRYPDLRRRSRELEDSAENVILVCYSGNRSSELCEEFTAQGIECWFMVGGYEKWIVEDRPLDLASSRDPDALRCLPQYPGKDVLLDTADVERLIVERDAVFVDVRYEGDYARFHLPNAINIPLRKLETGEMDALLDALPQRPIIAPSYDKRSSFYGLILGLRLHRRGYEFLGRYTVPHEYFVAKTPRPHVAEFVAANNSGVFGFLSRPLQGLLRAFEGWFGHLAIAIAAAVFLLRALLVPFTLKNERDQYVTRQLAPQIAAIRSRTTDAARSSRAVLALQREARLTPGRNLVGSLVQLVLFIVFFGAVSSVAAGSTDGFLWIERLAQADPFGVLPALLGAIVLTHLEINAARRSWLRRGLHAAAAVALFWITFQLPAALSFYLVLSVGFMMVQNRAVRFWLARRESWRERVLEPEPLPARAVAPLSLAHRVPGGGNKALKLAQLKTAGFPVPDGFVVTAQLFDGSDDRLELTDRQRRDLDRAWQRLSADRVAVRSSGLNEDGEDQSYAGIFESKLDVDRDGLVPALEEVYQSLRSTRVAAYSADAETGGVLVQEMVPAQYAGVLFTEHPGETGSLLVEMVEGLGEALVSGAATPEGYRFGRFTGKPLDETAPPIDLEPLIAMARRVEDLYGKPQDIEWAYAGGRFLLLQTRDITASSTTRSANAQGHRHLFETERRRLLRAATASSARSEAVVFEQNELSELLPRPTPLSLSLMRALWGADGSAEIACRDLGIPYAATEDGPPVVEAVFGALYVNRVQEARAIRKGPGATATFRLARGADALRDEFRDEFLPNFLRDSRRREAIDLSRLDRDDLIDLFDEWCRQFIESTYVEAERVNVAADFHVKAATRRLEKAGLAAAEYLAHMPETVVHRAMSLLPEINEGRRERSEFVAVFGHRAPHDWELAAPRYYEQDELVDELVARAATSGATDTDSRSADLPRNKMLALVVERAREFQALKEEAKHHCLRELALLRRVLLEIDRRLGLEGAIFNVEIDEIVELKTAAGRQSLATRMEERQKLAAIFDGVHLPTRLTRRDLESLEVVGDTCRVGGARRAAVGADGSLGGMLVAGDHEAVGRARVVRSSDEIDRFRDGEILVARFTDPTWTPLFARAGAVVTEVGGRLSHAAIVAREYNVTAVVGVEGVFDTIETGDVVKVHLDGRVERLEERRESRRRGVEIRASLVRQGAILDALVHDLSSTGALVSTEGLLESGQDVVLSLPEAESLEAEVVRHDEDGRYALRFTRPVEVADYARA